MPSKKKKETTFFTTKTLNLEEMQNIPKKIGKYRILNMLGRGGMSIVFLAQQEKPIRRKVALKVIKPGMDTQDIIGRFESEQQALALLNHPNIAQVYDSGTTEQGHPFFVMEYVPGLPITQYCDKYKLTIEARLRLFMDICNAIQHAHFNGIIHRDLKPSNILVYNHDNKHVPKIIDFGIAKALTGQGLTDKTVYTAHGVVVGTPAYMSPEQAELTGYDIDTRTDIYSLGIILYEILVGFPPFEEEELKKIGLLEILRIIREKDPPKPSTKFISLGDTSTEVAKKRQTNNEGFIKKLKGDLDWIVMRAMYKEKSRRYSSAHELRTDIERFLKKEPVLARPPSTGYKLHKYIKRNKIKTIAAGLIFLSLIIGSFSIFIYQKYRKEHLIPKKIYPEAIEGVFYQNSLIQGSLQIFPATKIQKFSYFDREKMSFFHPEDGLPDWLKIKSKFKTSDGIGILFEIDTSKTRIIDNWLFIDNGYGRRTCDFKFQIIDDELCSGNVLFVDSPIDMYTTAQEIKDLMRIIAANKIKVHFLHMEPEELPDISEYTAIILHSIGPEAVEKEHLNLIYSYIENGGNLILMAGSFIPASLVKANLILKPFGITIPDTDYFKITILDNEYIEDHQITNDVNSLKFIRFSPIQVHSNPDAKIIVKNPYNETEGLIVIYENKGRLIVIGTGSFYTFSSYEMYFDNGKLFENLLKLERK